MVKVHLETQHVHSIKASPYKVVIKTKGEQ